MHTNAVKTTSKPISMAVVGHGQFGRTHADKVAQSANANLVAIAEIDADRAAEAGRARDVRVVQDYRELFGAVDAVSIVVPTLAHYEVAADFLRNGVDVLVEKPITDDPATAEHLVELARQENRILQVGHLERFSSVSEVLRRHLKHPLFIDSVRVAPFQARGTDVNVILDLMIHDLDLVLSFIDYPILSIDAVGGPVFSQSDDIASARIKFDNGCVANIVASRIGLKTERKMRIFQLDSCVIVDYGRRRICNISKPAGPPPKGPGDIDITEESYELDDPLQKEIDSFALAVAERGTPVVSGEDGLRAVRAAITINDSIRAHTAFVKEAYARHGESKGAA